MARRYGIAVKDAKSLVKLVVEGTHTGAPYNTPYDLPSLPARGGRIRSEFPALVQLNRDGLIKAISRYG